MNKCIPALSDTHAFVESLDASIASLPAGWRNFFDSPGELIVTRAPGRLDLMGGIADYSGSLVLQWPIHSAAHVAIQQQSHGKLRLASVAQKPNERARVFEIDLVELLAQDYATLRAYFAEKPENHWAAYVAG